MQNLNDLIIAISEPALESGLPAYPRMVARLLHDTGIHLVHVIDRSRASHTSHRDALNLLRQTARREFGSTRPVTCSVLQGDRLDALLQYAVETAAGTIIVGHRQTRYPKRTLARRLAMKAPCSVWLAPDGSPPRIRRIFTGIDFSTSASRALDAAMLLAGRASAASLAFHVSRVAAGLLEVGTGNITVPMIFDPGPSVSEAVGRLTSPANGDLIVIGARGQSSASTVLLGREADQLLLESRTPVLVFVPQSQERVSIVESLLDRRLASPERVA